MVAIFAVACHAIADYLYLYWTFKPTDIFMHILGGFMAGLWALVFLRWLGKEENWLNVTLTVIIIGLGWEGLEIFYKVADFDLHYLLDSIKDMIDDVIGGTLSMYFWKILPNPTKKS